MSAASTFGEVKRHLVPLLLLGSLVFAALLYINAQYPELAWKLGIMQGSGNATAAIESNTSRQNFDRVRRINALVIAESNKIDLRQGRPFWGAATHMVELAFAGAADEVSIQRQGQRMFEFHSYGFGGNREPVVMEFHDNSLSCVHYPQRENTRCSAGVKSFYDGRPFPFQYEVTISN